MSLDMDAADVDGARAWVAENCHCGHARHTLLLALDYAAAVEHAGLVPDVFGADTLLEFLTDDRTRQAFVQCFPQPTL